MKVFRPEPWLSLRPTGRCAIKQGSKVVNRDWVNNQACSLLHNIHVVSGSFITNDYFPKLIRKILSTNNFSELIHQVSVEKSLSLHLLISNGKKMSQVMRLCYFSSPVNSFFKRVCAAIQWARCLIFVRTLRLLPFLCVRTAKALVRLCGCAGSPEPSLVAYVISTIISWAGSNHIPLP